MRSLLHGPLPATTAKNSFQSIDPKSCWPKASFHRKSASGIESPRNFACGTVLSTNSWRNSSFDFRLIRQAMLCAELGLLSSLGPNIINEGHHQRFSASCAMSFCS